MPLLGLLLFLHIKIDTTSQLIELVSMPLLGLLLFLPYPLGKNPYFPSLPSVFIFSTLFRKFLAYIAYIGTFLHLHNLNKAISHIFSKNYFDFLFAPLLSCTFFSCQGFKIAQTLQTTLDRTFLCKSLPITSGNFSVAVLLSQFWCSHGSPESCKEMRHSYIFSVLLHLAFTKCKNKPFYNHHATIHSFHNGSSSVYDNIL